MDSFKATLAWSLLILLSPTFSSEVAAPGQSPTTLEPTPSQSSAPSSPAGSKKFKDLLISNSSNKKVISCPEILDPSSGFSCDDIHLPYLDYNQNHRAFTLSIKNPTDTNKFLMVWALPSESPEQLDAMQRNYNTQKELDTKYVRKVLSVLPKTDYLVLVTEYQKYLLAEVDTEAILTESPANKVVKSAQQAIELIRWLHKQGWMAGDLDFTTSNQKDNFELRLGNLNCLTRFGEPIGPCYLNSRFTDPRLAQSNGKFMADEGADCYAVGRFIWEMVSNDGTRIVMNEDGRVKPVPALDELEFQEMMDWRLALLLTTLLQPDVSARANRKLIDYLIEELAPKESRKPLGEKIVWSTKTDPSTVPGLQKFFKEVEEWIGAPVKTPAQEKNQAGAEAGPIPSGKNADPPKSKNMNLLLVSAGALGLLAIFVGIYLCCRKGDAEKPIQAEIHQELDETAGKATVVVLKD